jgi:hypothetical protein
MDVLYSHCTGLAVHTAMVVANHRWMVDGKIEREVRTVKTTTKEILDPSAWLAAVGCRRIVMAGSRQHQAGFGDHRYHGPVVIMGQSLSWAIPVGPGSRWGSRH